MRGQGMSGTSSKNEIAKDRVSDASRDAGGCFPQVHPCTDVAWNAVQTDVLRIERELFGATAFDEDYLRDEFCNPRNVVIVLIDPSLSRIVGYAWASPIGDMEGIRIEESSTTAYIANIAIDFSYQRKHLTGPVMDLLEAELRIRRYSFWETDAVVRNRFAANLAKVYSERIVHQSGPHESEYGPQMFFRIRL